MKTIEDIIKLLGVGVLSVKKHGKASTAEEVAEFRQTLLTDVKAISANSSAELTCLSRQVVAMEKALVQHDLEYYANSKTMIGSLNTALSEFAMIERQLGKVDDLPAAGRPGEIQGHRPEFWPGQKPQQGPAPGRGPAGVQKPLRAAGQSG